MSRLLTNKYLLIGLGIIAVIGLLYISLNASKQLSSPTSAPAPTQQALQPKTATLPPHVTDHPISGQIIIKFKPQYTDAQINAHLQQYNASIQQKIEGINQTVVKVPPGQEQIIMQKLLNDGYAQSAMQDTTTHAFFVPNDPGFSLQYAFKNMGQAIQGKAGKAGSDINIESAWDVTQGNGVKVAILDTGINLNQPDLSGKVVLQKSFVPNATSVEDGNGHGTHVAGILAADTNNGTGIAGTCPGCQLLVGKVLDDSGSGATSQATAGITWAADNGAKVISMSLGTTDSSTASLYNQAVNYALSKGAVVVAAAGNDGNNQLNYPAAATGVISVAATTNIDAKASYSNFGSWVQIAAPGDNIVSTGPTHAFQLEPNGYNFSSPYYYLSGTSMATPFVAGVAALVASTQFGTTPQALTSRLYATADKIAGTGTSWINGRVNAAAAVGPAPTATTAPQPTAITPTLFCEGGNGTPPCATLPPSGVTSVPPASGNNPTVALTSPAVGGGNLGVNPTSPINTSPTAATTPTPTGTTPNLACANITAIFYNLNPNTQKQDVSAMERHHHKAHKKGNGNGNPNGGLSQFFQFLLELLQLLLQLIGQCTMPPATGTPIPTATPATAMPTVSTAPTTNTVSPTTGTGITP
jgi:thermitase